MRTNKTECILFTGRISERGYGKIGGKGYAHRLAWIEAYGPIPDGMVVDHECHNEAYRRGECLGGPTCLHRRCVNPLHLRLTTPQANAMAGAIAKPQGMCNKGHPFDGVKANGRGFCTECRRAYNVEWYSRNSEARKAYMREWHSLHPGYQAQRRARKKRG